MEAYQYKYGDRPLEGYTIQRAAGRGGFGEVYYAISDSGRQVALKVVQTHEQIELRGISQCMNLKSPHLVTIFDVKHNDQGRPFVVMEYVSGPSLSDLLKECPGGLGTQKAAFFLREIAKGLSYLHECGIVHRDLKPSNIFYENGYVKIGDYGLTKAMNTSRQVSHTITVGTVHYMAPEIGAGRYDRSVDIYALGVLLYEMLTGQVPFLGASPGEILMKHMSATPDLSHIEEPFARVIAKSLAKDPAERYQTVQEMVEDIFGTEHVRNSVSQFSPEELSVVAEHVARKIDPVTPGPATPPGQQGYGWEKGPKAFGWEGGPKPEQFARKAGEFSGRVAQKVQTARERAQAAGEKMMVVDSLQPGQRLTLAAVTMAAISFGAAVLSGSHDGAAFMAIGLAVFLMTSIASKVILYSRRQWWAALDRDTQWLGKAATCFGAAFLAVMPVAIFSGMFGVGLFREGHEFGPFGRMFRGFPFPFRGVLNTGVGGCILALALPMLLVDWLKITAPKRSKRIELGYAIWLGFIGMAAGAIFHCPGPITACTLAGIVLIVQAISPMGEEVSRADARAQRYGSDKSSVVRPVWPAARTFWLIAWLACVGVGLFFVIMADNWHGGDERVAIAFGVDAFIAAAFCFLMMCRSKFAGWYRYLVRPLILLGCVLVVVGSAILVDTMRGDAEAVAIFFIIFPSIVFLVFLVTPAKLFGALDSAEIKRQSARPGMAGQSAGASPRKRTTALLLSLVAFLPVAPFAGLHRFYAGKIGTGILWMFTWGLGGIGQIIDIIRIATGEFRDNYGLPLLDWGGSQSTTGSSVPRPAVAAPAAAQAAAPEQAGPAAAAVDSPTPTPAPVQPASSPSFASTGTVMYEPWRPLSGLMAGAGHLLVFVAFVIGMLLAFHMPNLISLGFPDPNLAEEMKESFGSDWVGGMEKMGMAIAIVLFLIGATLVIIGRRVNGFVHIFRALVGLGGIGVGVMFMIDELFSMYRVQQIQPETAMEFLQALQEEVLAVGGIGIVISLAILAWPPRRRQLAYGPMPVANQGVSA